MDTWANFVDFPSQLRKAVIYIPIPWQLTNFTALLKGTQRYRHSTASDLIAISHSESMPKVSQKVI
jgi:hypothetical protein